MAQNLTRVNIVLLYNIDRHTVKTYTRSIKFAQNSLLILLRKHVITVVALLDFTNIEVEYAVTISVTLL